MASSQHSSGRVSALAVRPRAFPDVLAELPLETEWLANIVNPHTRRAYRSDLLLFVRALGLVDSADLLAVQRAHIIAWREELIAAGQARATVRRRLAAVGSLYRWLFAAGHIPMDPAAGVQRPSLSSREGRTPALSAEQAAALLARPVVTTLLGCRDHAILSVLLYQGLRRAEVCALRARDCHLRGGALHLRVRGKRGKTRYVPVSAPTADALVAYLARSQPPAPDAPLFRSVRSGRAHVPLTGSAIYKRIVLRYARAIGLTDVVDGMCVHALRATAATQALASGADVARVMAWLGHADVSTTLLYDRRGEDVADSPSYRVAYPSADP